MYEKLLIIAVLQKKLYFLLDISWKNGATLDTILTIKAMLSDYLLG